MMLFQFLSSGIDMMDRQEKSEPKGARDGAVERGNRRKNVVIVDEQPQRQSSGGCCSGGGSGSGSGS